VVDHGRFGTIEWAAAYRPRPGEQVCGDRSIALGVGQSGALFGVLDGLGHGAEAATAASRGLEVLRGAHTEPLDVLVQLCHRALTATRGAAMTLARIDFDAHTLSWIGIGNVTASLVAKHPTGVEIRSSARLDGGIVGYRIPDRLRTQTASVAPGDLLLIASDGVADDYMDDIDFAAPAAVIAEQILRRHSKEADDALVLTARHRGPSS
jgi:serine phosphatase RsbU (regulator of sigma subunit)